MPASPQNPYLFEEFRFDPETNVLFRSDTRVEITPKAGEILKALLENAGNVVTKEALMRRAWPDSFVEDANLSHHIFNLRKAVGEQMIDTVPKRGYRFVGAVKQESANAPNSTLPVPLSPDRRSWFIPLIGIALLGVAAAVGWLEFVRKAEPSPPVVADSIKAIAVLPFVNESGNADVEYLADGLTESLIGSLAQLSDLAVKPRSAVFRYKGREVSAPQVGEELSVNGVLFGRITQRGDEITLFLSLIETTSEYQVWGKQYVRKLTELASLQNEIARDVSQNLKERLSGDDERKLAKKNTTDAEAYRLYLLGRYYWNKRTKLDLEKSIQFLQQAVEKDPTFALAYSGLADAYLVTPSYSVDASHDSYPKARAAALRALELDDSLANAHATLGALYEYHWNFEESERHFRRAIELDPDYATAHHWYAEYLLSMNRLDEALAEIRRAQESDPLSLSVNTIVGVVHMVRGEYELAETNLRKTIEMDPNFPRAHLFLARTYEEQGKLEDALVEWERVFTLTGMSATEAAQRLEPVKAGLRTNGPTGYWRAQAALGVNLQDSRHPAAPPYRALACMYAQGGDAERAIQALESSFERREPWILRLGEGCLNPLRSNPRFKEIVRRTGLPN